MRMLLKAQADTLNSNPKIKDGSLGHDLDSIIADAKPEAVYFYLEGGRRTAQMIFDIQDQSDLPAIIEPWLLAFGADVMVTPVLNGEDFAKAGPALSEIGQRYG